MRWYDYSSWWGYFFTICTDQRIHYFGKIFDDSMILNDIWNIAYEYRCNITNCYKSVVLDEFIIMPNHIHGIILLGDWWVSLSTIIKWYKQVCSKKIRNICPEFTWQKSFHDHIIRNSIEYERIKYYIQTNPKNWYKDKFSL